MVTIEQIRDALCLAFEELGLESANVSITSTDFLDVIIQGCRLELHISNTPDGQGASLYGGDNGDLVHTGLPEVLCHLSDEIGRRTATSLYNSLRNDLFSPEPEPKIAYVWCDDPNDPESGWQYSDDHKSQGGAGTKKEAIWQASFISDTIIIGQPKPVGEEK